MDKPKIKIKISDISSQLIGRSLSLCVADILDGTVPQDRVIKIISSTKFNSEAEFEKILEQNTCCWSLDPELGKQIAREFYEAGKINQPRLSGKKQYNIGYYGHWMHPETKKTFTIV